MCLVNTALLSVDLCLFHFQVCVWGRCDYGEGVSVDVSGVRVHHYPGAIVGPDPFSLPLTHCLHDSTWLADGIMEDVKTRAGKIHGILSEAVAIGEMARKWITSQTCTETDMRCIHRYLRINIMFMNVCLHCMKSFYQDVPLNCQHFHKYVTFVYILKNPSRHTSLFTLCYILDGVIDTYSDVWQSVGVISDGNCYGFPEGVACSVPAKCEGGEWKVVRDLQLSPTIQVEKTL